MIILQLSRGQVAVIDADRIDLARQKWYALPRRNKSGFYAACKNFGQPAKLLHRAVLGVDQSVSLDVDHINGDTLNCRRENLRLVTRSQNMMNARSSGACCYKGVRKDPRYTNRWVAKIGRRGEVVNLGRFDNPVDAARAYDAAALDLYGDFARLNFPARGFRTMSNVNNAYNVKIESFVGECNILGTPRDVCYIAKDDANERSAATLIIEGVTIEDAWQILGALNGGLIKKTDPEYDAPDTKPTKPAPAPAPKAVAKIIDAVATEKPVDFAKAAKAKAKREEEEAAETARLAAEAAAAAGEDLDEDDLDGSTEDEPEKEVSGFGYDLEFLSQQSTLRPVIEHFSEAGYKTPAQIVAVASGLIEQCPALKIVAERGNFEKRIERAVTIAMGAAA